MRVQISTGVAEVYITHGHTLNHGRFVRATEVKVVLPPDVRLGKPPLTLKEYAVCVPPDVFNRRTGRIVAGRKMREMLVGHTTKADRTKILRQVFEAEKYKDERLSYEAL